jgi:hypothetical protein
MTCTNCGLRVRMPDYVLSATVLCPGCKKCYATQCRDYDEALRIVSGPGFTPPKSATPPEPPPASTATPTFPVVAPPPSPAAPFRMPEPPAPERRVVSPPFAGSLSALPEPASLPEPPPAPKAAPQPINHATMLASPHWCSQCKGTIKEPTGLRRTTINCPLCTKRTSLYSILFHCWKCQALLEAPTRCEGQQILCPNCQRNLEVPRDVIFNQAFDRIDERSNWFAFFCPVCDQEEIAEKKNVGKCGVCPHCLIVVEVPMWGHEAKPEPPPPAPSADPLASLKESAPIRCPSCYERIPAQSQVCRRCGSQVDSEKLHRDREV